MIIDPRTMDLTDWTDTMVLELDKYGPITKLMHPDQWREWANQVVQLLQLSPAQLNPFFFADWREWAIRFIQLAEHQLA